ncbi:major facilitator superfamily protein [Sarocladium implicatum]|nr:major facilitator superfamily protein [Sarocladium implicatum]
MTDSSIRRKPVPSGLGDHTDAIDLEERHHFISQGANATGEPATEKKHGASPVEGSTSSPELRPGWPKWQWPLLVTLNAVFFLLIGYDIGCIANIQAPIYQAFHNLPLLPWVALSYVAIGTACVPIIRKLLDVCDLRWQVPSYAAFLFMGATVSGSADSVEAVIIGRCLTGLGGAGIFQLVLTYLLICGTKEEYSRMAAACASCWAIGLTLGPIIAAGFAENVTWRWALYINLPILAILLALSFFAYPSVQVDSSSAALTHLKKFDWIGSVFYFSSVVMLFCCLMFSGTRWPWSDASTIVAWVYCAVGFTFLARQQIYAMFTTKEHRLIPADLICIRPVLLTLIATSGIGASYGISIYYTPLFFAFVHGSSPVEAAVRLLPFTGAFIGCSLIGGGILPRMRYYSPYYILSGICITVGAGLLTRVSPEMSESEVMGLTALVGAGAGMSWALSATVPTMSVPSNRRLDISALAIAFQIGGIALALAIAACVYRNMGFRLLSQTLRDSGIAADDIRELMAGLASETVAGMSAEDRANTIRVITDIIGHFYWMLVGAGSVVLVSGCLMDFAPLDFEAQTT